MLELAPLLPTPVDCGVPEGDAGLFIESDLVPVVLDLADGAAAPSFCCSMMMTTWSEEMPSPPGKPSETLMRSVLTPD